MTTQTSLVAEQVRLQQWAEQVRDCKNRPRGMDVETWCAQNNITKANYYFEEFIIKFNKKAEHY